MPNHKNCTFLIIFMLAVFMLDVSVIFGGEDKKIYSSTGKLIQDLGAHWETPFVYIRDNIRFEPSAHLFKSSQGVLWGRRGNAEEQAVLLMKILQDIGEKVRLVSGRLDDAIAASLIDSLFPQDKERDFFYAIDVPHSKPSEDETLLSNVRNHFWVQIYKDDQWLDLDPVFPGAKPGKAFTKVEKTYPVLSDDLFPKMMVSMSIEKGSTREDVLMLEEKLVEMVNQPVTLSISTNFHEFDGEERSGRSSGGLFGSLGRSPSGKKKTKGLEAIYLATLKIREGMEVSGKFKEKIPDSSQKASVKDPIKRVWLNFRLTGDGEVLLQRERILFEKNQDTDELPLFQRHSILVAPNMIPFEAWEDRLRKVTDESVLYELRSGVDEIKASIKAKKDKKILLDKSLALEEKNGSELGHLINMIFAYSSDSLTEDSGEALSVYSYFALPRIIIHSVEGNGKEVSTVMDLRHDSVAAVPYPGQAIAMRETFLYGRGVFESILEGKVLELFLNKNALTTAYVMQEADKNNVPIRFYSELEKDELEKLDMPGHVRDRALKSIASGSVLVIPERGVRFEGKVRWGWWQVQPQTKETIGVLDAGLHQAMLQRTVLDTEGMLNSKMGFAIGAITGAVDTQWMLATMVLKYGELNKAALQEIKAYMKQIKAYMCPEFEKSASMTVASVTVIDIEDCYKKEFSWKYEIGVKIEMGWCQAFAKGFGCASTSILNYYLNQYE